MEDKGLLTEFTPVKGSYVCFVDSKGGKISGIGRVVKGSVLIDKVNFVEKQDQDLLPGVQMSKKDLEKEKVYLTHYTLKGSDRVFTEREFSRFCFPRVLIDKVWSVEVNKEDRSSVSQKVVPLVLTPEQEEICKTY